MVQVFHRSFHNRRECCLEGCRQSRVVAAAAAVVGRLTSVGRAGVVVVVVGTAMDKGTAAGDTVAGNVDVAVVAAAAVAASGRGTALAVGGVSAVALAVFAAARALLGTAVAVVGGAGSWRSL